MALDGIKNRYGMSVYRMTGSRNCGARAETGKVIKKPLRSERFFYGAFRYAASRTWAVYSW